MAQDPDPVTRAELDALVASAEAGDAAAVAGLVSRFAGRLDFGTAGLRGELGAGPTRMNRVLVGQAAAGLAAFLLGREPNPSVVIGYDGRHNSAVFARDTAELMQGAGVQATILPRLLPTPVLAYAVRHLGASAGVMVTASHNPAADNGYKVYLGGGDGGSQIVPPADAEIQAEILRVAAGSIAGLPRDTGYATADEGVVEAYVRATAAVAGGGTPPTTLSYVYTPMHGVGLETARAVFADAGFPGMAVVPEQAEPDPDFPTVAFPNPEEPGAMDLALALAASTGADLVIANDPDADRVAVGVPDPDAAGGWRRLSGNEVGWLLGWRAARRAAGAGTGTLACSLVSSPALGAIAAASGMRWVETLTGFKWISRAPGLVFGYEEALGYLVDPDKIRDKDGISAAVAVLELFAELKAAGTTYREHLEAFAAEFGGYASSQISIRVADLAQIPATIGRLRDAPPASIGDLAVEGLDDFAPGFEGFPPSDILRFRVAGGRVIVRPSGTEPKLKCYLDGWSTEGPPAERLAEAERIVAALDAGMRELLEG
ncbi:MAG: phospho-sugar mutase [Microbacteriaceae bacterium]|nr:phospho-sugar mutase [Microbacteriaceae bacterium]